MNTPELRRKLDAAQDREDHWLAKQIEDAQPKEAIVDEIQVQRMEPNNDIVNEPNATLTTAQPATLGSDERDANDPVLEDFYEEVNAELQDQIGDDMIDCLKSVTTEADTVRIVHRAMEKILKIVRPRRPDNDAEFRELMTIGHQFGTTNVSEIYSPPRVAALAEQFGMRPGFSLDLTVLT